MDILIQIAKLEAIEGDLDDLNDQVPNIVDKFMELESLGILIDEMKDEYLFNNLKAERELPENEELDTFKLWEKYLKWDGHYYSRR
jgi:hypothetical protein